MTNLLVAFVAIIAVAPLLVLAPSSVFGFGLSAVNTTDVNPPQRLIIDVRPHLATATWSATIDRGGGSSSGEYVGHGYFTVSCPGIYSAVFQVTSTPMSPMDTNGLWVGVLADNKTLVNQQSTSEQYGVVSVNGVC
jgi:hypothetical protein